jgi:hypothetical protein
VADIRPGDDDPFESIRAWLKTNAAAPVVPVSPSATLQRRHDLLIFLQQLPPDRLWEWIDGLWLGRAPEAELAVLEECVRESAFLLRPASRRPRGRPKAEQLLPTVPPILNVSIRREWKKRQQALKPFVAYRRKHHSRMNRTRRGTPRSQEWRTACMASPIGQVVERFGLFAEFFDTIHLTPQEMAARLLHREEEQRLILTEHLAKGRAASSLSPDTRDYYERVMLTTAAQRRQLGRWKTLYNKLIKLR